MSDKWWTYSVPTRLGTLRASVKASNPEDALDRLRVDDDVWRSLGVYFDGMFAEDTEVSRVRCRGVKGRWPGLLFRFEPTAA